MRSHERTKWSLNETDLLPEGQVLVVPPTSRTNGADAIFIRTRVLPQHGQPQSLSDGCVALGFLNVCPHMGCSLIRSESAPLLTYIPDVGEVTVGPCPCHGSTFDLARAGLVIEGPATDRLPELTVVRRGLRLVATLDDPHFDPLYETKL